MEYKDLRDFIDQLEKDGDLKRISQSVDPNLEITEISARVLRAGGPALLFEHPGDSKIPLLANLFGTEQRVAQALGADQAAALREVGKLLAFLKEPEPPKGFKDAMKTLPIYKKILDMSPKMVKKPKCQEVQYHHDEVDLSILPIQTCWPGDVAPLITWGLVTTRGPTKQRQNLGIYRQQLIGNNRLIMRWLSHRGGALDYKEWRQQYGDEPFPVSVVLGCDPATILAAVTPIPDSLAEYANSLGLGHRTGIAFEYEKGGLIPTSNWKKRAKGEAWQEGETLSIAIGQGFDLVTPLQVCQMTSAVANGGILYRPQLIDRIMDPEGETIRTYEPLIDGEIVGMDRNLELIRKGLVEAVNGKRGTGKTARLKDIKVGGKTGTAQVVRLEKFEETDEEDVPYKYRDHAWFTSFAPAEKPEIAVTVLVEHGGHGGSAAGPIAQKVLARYFAKKNEPAAGKGTNSQVSLVEKKETLKVVN